MLHTLATIRPHPESVPINVLSKVPGTPMADAADVRIWETVRMIAATRILMPRGDVRCRPGGTRWAFSDQAMCFMAGANSIFSSEQRDHADQGRALHGLRRRTAMLGALGLTMRAPFVNPHSPRAEELAEQLEARRASSPSFCERKDAICVAA